MSDLFRLRRLRRAGRRAERADLARVPERRLGIGRFADELERARQAGITVEELDDHHVRLRYDASARDQWLAIDALYDAVQNFASVEGVDQTDAAPHNWMVVHLDYGSCGRTFAP